MTTATAEPRIGIGNRPDIEVARPRPRQPPEQRGRPAAEQQMLRLLQALTVLIVFGQRLAIPVGSAQISPVLIVIPCVAILLYRARLLVEDRSRTLVYATVSVLCLVAGLFSLVTGAPETSMNSLLLLVVLYAPFCLVLSPRLRHLFAPLLRWFCGCIAVIAAIAILQLAGQLTGLWHYHDLFASVVPGHFIQRGYETAYPIHFGSSLIKSNGVFCLEASFCSQLLALAIIGHLVLGGPRWRLWLYAGALVATVSGTGVVLLGAGLVVQMVRRGPRWTARVLVLIGLAVALAAATPPGRAALNRVTEVSYTNTSGNQRFVAPYSRMWSDLGGGFGVLLTGNGPGFADRQVATITAQTGLSAEAPPIPKLLIEYGLIAGPAFLGAVIGFLMLRTPSPSLSLALVVFYLFLSSSLLQPQTVYLSWLLASLFARPAPPIGDASLAKQRPVARRGPRQPGWAGPA